MDMEAYYVAAVHMGPQKSDTTRRSPTDTIVWLSFLLQMMMEKRKKREREYLLIVGSKSLFNSKKKKQNNTLRLAD